MAYTLVLCMIVCATGVIAQRPPFAGKRPIGYPDLYNRTTTEGLGDRFGEGTTERLPLEALGDKDLVDRISKLPVDKQPFWYINWKALEDQRKNPQTYPQKPNVFVDNIPPSNPSANVNDQSQFENRNGGEVSNTRVQLPSTSNANVNTKEEIDKTTVSALGNRFNADNTRIDKHNNGQDSSEESDESDEIIPNRRKSYIAVVVKPSRNPFLRQ